MERGRSWPLSTVLVLLCIALVARRWLDVVAVQGRSMAPSLLPGDLLLVERLTYTMRGPRPGDVALAVDPATSKREIVKRVAKVDASGVTLRGDNPAASTDARSFGPLPPSAARWRVVARYWPVGRIGRIPPAPAATDGAPARAELLAAGR